MKLSIATLLVGTAAASSIRADSKVGQKLINKARRLDGGNAMQWAAGYSIRFENCATTTDYYGGYFGGNNNKNNNNNNNNNRNAYNGMYEQRLVHFKLCPTSDCSSGKCNGGADYVIDMNEFVQAYLEHKQEAMEQECETVKENCYCENANDDQACEAQCYISAGIYENCVEQNNQNNGNNNGQQEQFDLQEAMECRRLEIDQEAAQYYAYGNNNGNMNYYNGNNNGQQNVEFFVGPYCSSNGKSILLGVFMDETCSFTAPDGIYEKFHYGKALPYSSNSIVTNECISCKQVDNNNQNQNNQNNNGNNNNNYVLEFCEDLYQGAGKCETNLDMGYGYYRNTLACDFIKTLSTRATTRFANALSDVEKNITPQILAGVFAATTLAFGGVAYFFHRKLQRSNVGLVGGEGNIMA